MGALFSTPASQETPLNSSGAGSSTPPKDSLLKDSPPHPSRSTFTRPRPRNALSYFLPQSNPELQHTHSSPTLHDIRDVISVLSTKLPPELVVRVLDEGRYWAGCRTLLTKEVDVVAASPHTGMRDRRSTGWRNGQEDMVAVKEGVGEMWYLMSEEIGCESEYHESEGEGRGMPSNSGGPSINTSLREKVVMCEGEEEGNEEKAKDEEGCWLREIVIETLSKDQGWSSAVHANPALYGTYDQSYSWFEISLYRGGKEVEGTRRSVQTNVHAGQYHKAHRNVLGPDDEIVRKAQKGDRVILWARAQYPGWRNIVREGAITLYCAPFPQA